MRWVWLIVCFFLAPALISPVPAQTADDRDWADCDQDADAERRLRGCTAVLNRGARETAQNRAIAFINRGNAYGDRDNWIAAVADYSDAINLDPRNTEAFAFRGFAYAIGGNLDAALADFNEAIRLDPRDGRLLRGRGIVHRERGDLDAAQRDFRAAVAAGFSNAQRDLDHVNRRIEETQRTPPPPPVAASGNPCAGQAPDRCWAFRCPPAGTQLTASDGSRVEYLGVVSNDPRICRIRATASGRPPEEVTLVFGMMFWGQQGDIEAERRAEADTIAPFFPARPGHSISYSSPSSRSTWSLRSISMENTVAGRRRAVRIVHRFEQPLPSQPTTIDTTTYVLDAETGAMIGGEFETRRGREVGREASPAITSFIIPAQRR